MRWGWCITECNHTTWQGLDLIDGLKVTFKALLYRLHINKVQVLCALQVLIIYISKTVINKKIRNSNITIISQCCQSLILYRNFKNISYSLGISLNFFDVDAYMCIKSHHIQTSNFWLNNVNSWFSLASFNLNKT